MTQDRVEKSEAIMDALHFVNIVESYGGAAHRWPDAARAPAQEFAKGHLTASDIQLRAATLDAALDTVIAPAPSEFLRARIMKAAHDLRIPDVIKAANDRLPFRAIAATLIVSAFLGFMGGGLPQLSGSVAYADTADTDMEVNGIDEHVSYAWIAESLSSELGN